MFDVTVGDDGAVRLIGRLDATQVEVVRATLEGIETSCTVDFAQLEYISSAGLGILLSAQKRLSRSGHALRLINLNQHISEIFRIAGFDRVFQID
jgi:anti-sigma B factor antagonist